MSNHKLLIVDDEKAICSSLTFTFEDEFTVITALDPHDGVEILKKTSIDILLLDLRIGNQSGLDWIESFLHIQPQLKIIMMTAYGTIESSVQAMKKGAYAYIEKPIHMEELKILLKKCLELKDLNDQIEELQRDLHEKYNGKAIIGKSKAVVNLYNMIEKVKNIDSTILIYGESGTGKELVAKAIHYSGERRKASFVDVNCASIPTDLLESELFGYEKGAFTGAHQKKPGKFVQANRGTLFLDEIGEMPLSLQSKLLRTIQEKEVIPLGSTEKISIDTKIIAATNRDLKQEVKAGRFREDLYFRLNVIPIEIPPLRERRDDIPLLVMHFLEFYSKEMGKKVHKLEPLVMKTLLGYGYPGNVRELSNIIERAVALCEGTTIKITDLPSEVLSHSNTDLEFNQNRNKNNKQICFSFGTKLKEVEKEIILYTLRQLKGHRKKTAAVLGISERGLREKLRKYKNDE